MIIKLNKDQEWRGKMRPEGLVMEVTRELDETLDCEVLAEEGHSESSAKNKNIIINERKKKNESKDSQTVEQPEG
jgi:hypothetical protein